MFCTRCGKQIDYDQPVCNECLQELLQGEQTKAQPQPQPTYEQPTYQQAQPTYQQPVYQQPQPAYNYAPTAPIAEKPVVIKDGKKAFGKALTSTILSTIAFIAMYIILIDALAWNWYYYWDPTTDLICTFLFTAPAVISIIFGAKSLRGSKSVSPEGRVSKHIPSFILGLVGMITGITAAFIAFINLCICASSF